MRLIVATSNPHKLREIRALLEGVPLELRALDRWPDLSAPEETGRTFEENARQKARYYAAVTGEMVVAEDSGLEIDALGGDPGVESARLGGTNATYPEKFALLDSRLRNVEDRTARFVCALALARGDSILFEARGTVEGSIAREPAGSAGFGYDPIFFYPPFGRTLAEADPREKAAISHRGQAFRQLRRFILEAGHGVIRGRD